MTDYIEKMKFEMELRGFSKNTMAAYSSHANMLLRYFKKPADQITPDEIKRYLYKAFYAMKGCRTSSQGSHADVCGNCGHVEISYNSCRNRNCPKCQASRQEE